MSRVRPRAMDGRVMKLVLGPRCARTRGPGHDDLVLLPAVQRHHRPVEVRAPVAEQAPGAARDRDLVEIEARGQNRLARARAIGDAPRPGGG